MLRFGTAGLRGPLREGPDGMNVTTVSRATAGVVEWLRGRCLGGGRVVVGRDARHGSHDFATATAEIFAAAGFDVTLLPRPLPTPVVAFAVRELGAVAGVQITASHNPPADNGYKLYLDGGSQLIAPADTEIERCIEAVAEPIDRAPVEPAGDGLAARYLDRVAGLPAAIGGPGERAEVRVALTPLHGVGGELAVGALVAAGFTDVHVVDEQFAPDPDFPTVAFPNPEEPGAADLLLALADRVDADIAIALDPDADRCAVGVRGPDGWRMLRGDDTGVLLGDYVLRTAPPDSLVATTVVSSRLLSKLAPARGARYAETLTGFKWLARAGDGLVYAYEEAIGHCVDPATVRDKDGISAAVLAVDLVARLKARGRTLHDDLADYAVEFGLHAGDQVSLRLADADAAAAVVARLRTDPPADIAGEPMKCTDLLTVRGRMRTDALIFEGDTSRVVIRPSGTEPKLKCYLEVVVPVDGHAALPEARRAAAQRLSALAEFCRAL
ncbi:phospho-sugar mutase [Nocardia puris]|uniref:Phosphomannomutase n=1 Tax=Nocardia puris TaxID=208602 RepID=A0A366D811_9NOCA|nr:phospho-sugar mutase [Nocardia puris]MBF6212399.1 phospho-sugar mutase [Nocardia puris]MBF6366646.1 phospho-sugar mutase [Nocardia puris]MBF6460988.1 phospho-sugar mutase [Nocardia puris]RBO85639.1 phosphomannomutase [Nocardia puris]